VVVGGASGPEGAGHDVQVVALDVLVAEEDVGAVAVAEGIGTPAVDVFTRESWPSCSTMGRSISER